MGAAGAAGRGGNPPIESPEGAQPAVSDQEKAQVAADAAAQAAKERSGQFLQYLGPINAQRAHDLPPEQRAAAFQRPGIGSYAEITPAQWGEVGIESDGQAHVWALENDHRIPVARFSQAQLDYLLTKDAKRFAVVDSAGNRVKR